MRNWICIIIMATLCLLGCSSKDDEGKINNGVQTEITHEQKKETNDASQNGDVNNVVDASQKVEANNAADAGNIVITWAFNDHSFEERSTEMEERFNKKLEDDGYPYRLKFIFLDDNEYIDLVKDCDADIVYTGLRTSDGGRTQYPAYGAINEGKYLRLDEYLKDSSLYDLFHPMEWDAVRVNGSIYCIPSGDFVDSGLTIVLNKKKYSYEDVEKLDDKLSGVLSLISSEKKLLYETYDFSYLDMYGIPNSYDGWAIQDGKYVSVLNLDITLEWIDALNNLRNEGKIIAGVDVERTNPDEWAIGMLFSDTAEKLSDDEYWKINYKGDLVDKFSAAKAIRANSKHPKEAFELLQLIMTNPDYGNLIIFGDNYEVDEEGYAINPETGNPYYVYMLKLYFGINTGVYKGAGDYYVFKDSEERRAYYEKHLRPLDLGYLEIHEMINNLNKLVKRYYNLTDYSKKYTDNNYDEELEAWIRRSREVVENWYK